MPAKYPGKTNYKPGANYGKPSGNPLGKNPSDIWKLLQHEWEQGLWCIPNVKSNHPEKTLHPCQFPIELVERCVLALTNPGDWVLDPFSGVGSSLLAALRWDRKALVASKCRNTSLSHDSGLPMSTPARSAIVHYFYCNRLLDRSEPQIILSP